MFLVEDLEELEAHLGRLLEDPTLPINEALTGRIIVDVFNQLVR